MAAIPKVTVFHAPNTRSTGTVILMEELGVPYDLNVVNLKAGEQRKPAYLAVNPMGKVPAVKYGEALITEQPAIFIFLADLYPQSGLAPAANDQARGAYLRWLVYYGSCFEPAVVDKALKRDPAPLAMSPYGDFDTMLKTLSDHMKRAPYMTGDQFSAADVLWGTAMRWMLAFKLVPETPEFAGYRDRIISRPSFKKVEEMDKKLAAEHEAAAAKSA